MSQRLCCGLCASALSIPTFVTNARVLVPHGAKRQPMMWLCCGRRASTTVMHFVSRLCCGLCASALSIPTFVTNAGVLVPHCAKRQSMMWLCCGRRANTTVTHLGSRLCCGLRASALPKPPPPPNPLIFYDMIMFYLFILVCTTISACHVKGLCQMLWMGWQFLPRYPDGLADLPRHPRLPG